MVKDLGTVVQKKMMSEVVGKWGAGAMQTMILGHGELAGPSN